MSPGGTVNERNKLHTSVRGGSLSEDINYKRFLSTMLRLSHAMQNLLNNMHIIDTAMVVGLGMSILRLSGWQAGGFSDKSVFSGFARGSAYISQYWGVRDLADTKNVRARGCQLLGAHLHAGSDAPGAMIRLYTGEAAGRRARTAHCRAGRVNDRA